MGIKISGMKAARFYPSDGRILETYSAFFETIKIYPANDCRSGFRYGRINRGGLREDDNVI